MMHLPHSLGRRIFVAATLLSLQLPAVKSTQEQGTPWDVTAARGKTREIDFTTSEGTGMSVDISADGRWIVFDLLAQVYRVPAEGGAAECLTQNSGVATNYHPRFSPDGRQIAFISDRRGQSNLWVMNADGSDPHPVFTDLTWRAVEPAWTPDGQYIIVRRQQVSGPQPRRSGLWMFHRAGGEGVELTGPTQPGASWPSVSRDGRYVYFQVTQAGPRLLYNVDLSRGDYQIRRLDRAKGDVMQVTMGQDEQQFRGSSGGAIAPEVSPDGRWLAFARKIPNGTISWKGHKFGPRTALWLRDLRTGAERMVMDPIELDMSEGMASKTLRVLPGYAWAADGKTIVIAQGGKLRRLDVQGGTVSTIPFTARVRRTISEMAYAPSRISDDPLEVRFLRWHTGSPDGRRLAFEAVGKLWIMDLPRGTPRALVDESFYPLQFAPAWSPDGRWLAFTSWDDGNQGKLWKIRVDEAGATGNGSAPRPEPVIAQQGEYLHPVWSPDGRSLIVTRGAGATARGQNFMNNPWYEIVRVPAAGGEPEVLSRVDFEADRSLYRVLFRQITRAAFGPEGRVFFHERKPQRPDGTGDIVTNLVSVKPDASDRRTHLTLPYGDEIVPSPDGKWVAYNEGDNIYLSELPWEGTGGAPIHITRRQAKIPVRQLTLEGGLFPRWRDASTLEFGNGTRYFVYHVATQSTDTINIQLRVPRDIPKGTIALTGGRILTMEKRQIIPRGTVVVTAGRISCVGQCDTSRADKVVDVSGKTLIPGIIDMHTHHFREHRGINPRHNYETAIYLAYGVTTGLDPSAWDQNVFTQAEMIEVGNSIGPRTFSPGSPLYAGDEARQDEITSYDAAERQLRRLMSWGAVSVKSYMQPRRDQRQWIVDVARKHGLEVTGEGGPLEYNVGLIMDGQTGWEHPFDYVPLYGDVAKFFGKAGATYSATPIVAGPGPWNEEYFYQESEIWKDEKQQRWLPWRQLVPHTRRRALRPVTDYSFPMIAQGVADIIAEGGYGAVGSHDQHHGLSPHWEIWVEASALGPMGALELATQHGAHFLGMQQDLGSLAVGKLGDVLVLNSNPLDNIRNTTDIRYVMKGGIFYDAATLDELWPRQRPFGPYYWVNKDALAADDRPINYWDRR